MNIRRINGKYILRIVYGFLIICLISLVLQLGMKFDLSEKVSRVPLLNQKSIWYEKFEDIPQNLTKSIVAIEDKRFRYHPGIDLIAFSRAMYQTIWNNQIQGWSTIDQQLVKLKIKNYDRNVWNKLYEWRRALNLQFHYSKQEILLAYVNTIPFSHDIKGRKAACAIYLHKDCGLLSDAELSYVMTLLQMGSNPYKQTNQNKIVYRATNLCKRMTLIWITKTEWCALLADWLKLDYYEPPLEPRVEDFLSSFDALHQKVFDLNTYKRIKGILANTKSLRDEYAVKDCCVVILNTSWDLVSMNMCSSWDDDEAGRINLCTKPRQTWSAIKPFLYSYAFRKLWLKPDDTIVDEPVQYDLWDGSIYEPKNFDLDFHGMVTLAFALGNSLNVPAIKLVDRVWVSNFLGFLKTQLQYFAPGLDKNDKLSDNVWLSVALGTYELSPYVFTQLRRMFLQSQAPSDYILQTKQVVDILSNPNNKVESFGQDNFLNSPGRAIKTGTSRKFIDGWVCGANNAKGLTMCVWMGNYNNEAMKGASSEVGSYVRKVIAEGL